MWKSDKNWSEDIASTMIPVAPTQQGEKVMRCQGKFVMFCAGNEYGVRDLETGKESCPRSPHLQVVQELYEHTWRRHYAGDIAKGFK